MKLADSPHFKSVLDSYGTEEQKAKHASRQEKRERQKKKRREALAAKIKAAEEREERRKRRQENERLIREATKRVMEDAPALAAGRAKARAMGRLLKEGLID